MIRRIIAGITLLGITASGGWAALPKPNVTVTASPKAGGTVTPGTAIYAVDASQDFLVAPIEPAYKISKLTVKVGANPVTNIEVPAQGTYTYQLTPLTGTKYKITATFAKKTFQVVSRSDSDPLWGTIAPAKTARLTYGANQKYTIAPKRGYTISDVTVNGESRKANLAGTAASGVRTLMVTNITADTEVVATFELKGANAQALRVADKISLVDAKDAEGNALHVGAMRIGAQRVGAMEITQDSDYTKDQTKVYVDERSMEQFNTINEILCMLSQAKYDLMLNKGDYKALIDRNQCAAASDQGDSSADAGAASAPHYASWTLNSSRESNDAPQVVKVWLHEEAEEYEPEKLIMARLEITQGASESNSYGLFTLNFAGYPVSNGSPNLSQRMMRGYLKTELQNDGKVLLKFAEGRGPDEGGWVTLNRSNDGSSGTGSVGGTRDGKSGSMDIAFNTDLFRRFNAGAPLEDPRRDVCLDRNTFEESAWRYSLYDSANGNRVNRNSGFSVRKTVNDKNYYGWVGYYGLWFPNEVTLDSGQTVYRDNHDGNNQGEAYTVMKANGKLKKHTRHQTTLGEIRNLPLQMWIQADNSNARVHWDGINFIKDATMTCGQNGCSPWEEVEPTPLVLTGLNWDELNFWSQSLGGQARVKLACDPPPPPTPPQPGQQPPPPQPPTFNNCFAADDFQVTYFAEDMVYPDDVVPSSLRCYDNCPQVTAEGITGGSMMGGGLSVAYNYTFSTSDMLLRKDNLPAVLNTGNVNGGMFMSGPLFEPTDEILSQLVCDWDQTHTQICGWKAWSTLDLFYTWESGINNWNRFIALKDANNAIVRFEPPLQVKYVHTQADPDAPDYKYDGTTFFLDYAGFGQLQGIPGKCVDMDTGRPVNECSGMNTRWVAEFTIPNGAAVTDGTDAEYLVKALEKSQRMRLQADDVCSGLTIQHYPELSLDAWRDPAIGSEPSPSGPPAVIGGVVQQ